MIIPVQWTDEGVKMLDQRLLADRRKMADAENLCRGRRRHKRYGRARRTGNRRFRRLRHRARRETVCRHELDDLEDELDYICEVTGKTRPTAVNLFWAIDRMKRTFAKSESGRQINQRDQTNFD